MPSYLRIPSFLVLASLLFVSTATTTFAATSTNNEHQNDVVRDDNSQSSSSHYNLRSRDLVNHIPHVLCRVTMVDTEYDDDHDGVNDEQPSCIPIVDWVETDDIFPLLDLDEDFFQTHLRKIAHGKLLVKVTHANLTDTGVVTSPETQYKLLEDDNRDNHPDRRKARYLRQLAATDDTVFEFKPQMTLAIVRISTQDAQPQQSLSSLKASLFGTGINLVTQYDACSFGKLKWSLSTHPNALIDVTVPMSITAFANNAGGLITAAQQTLKNDPTNSIEQVSALADKVIMCVPPGTGNWAASAGVKHWRVQMNNLWCSSLSGTVHELGHTMGLLHSNSEGMAYNDRSGYMGSGYTDATWPRKCFNGFNSWHFGWYSDKHIKVNPITDGDHLFHLAAFTDYDVAESNEPVLINVADMYYLQYNRAKKFNIDTEMKQNQVTITQDMTDGSGTDSLAGLNAGEKFQMSVFLGEGLLIIEACEAKTSTSGGADYMVISIGMGKSLCGSGAVETSYNGSGGIQLIQQEQKKEQADDGNSEGFFNSFIFWLLGVLRRSRKDT